MTALLMTTLLGAQPHETYRLSTTTAQVLATVAKIRAAVDRRALKVGRYTVDDRLLPLLLWATNDVDESYADLAAMVRVLRDAARAGAGPASVRG